MKVSDLIGPSRLHTRAIVDTGSAVRGLRSMRADVRVATRADRTRKGGIRAFCLTYLKHHFTAGFSEIHHAIFKEIDQSSEMARIALIAPRKFGKTTIISLALPLQQLAYELSWFILLIGESATTSESNLATITQELETNDLLLNDFPHLKPAIDRKGQTVRWTDRQLILSNFSTVMARGMGARMRGLKYRQRRPDLGILDDPESPETADTFLKRRRHKRWFGGTFMGLGADNWNLYVIGNLPHHDCLIADLVRSSEWHGSLWRAVNRPASDQERYPVGNTRTDGTPLWPEVWGHTQLARYKKEPNVGALGFAREMMNDPREEEDKPFDPASFTYFEWTPDRLAEYQIVGTTIDPAGGEHPGEVKKGRRDWAVVVTGGRTYDGYVDVFDISMTKLTPNKQIDIFLDHYDRWRPRWMGAEENMFVNLLGPTIYDQARDRGLYPHVEMIRSTKNKIARILGMEPHTTNGTIRFARHLVEKFPTFFGQWDEFPGDYDDGPDATEMLVRLLESKHVVGMPQGVGSKICHWRS